MFTDMNIGTVDQNDPTTRKNIFWAFEVFLRRDERPLPLRIYYLVRGIQVIYYPILAMTALPVISVTIKILSRGNCGLSKNVTLYLLAMAAADLLIVIFDLIMRQIPIAYRASEHRPTAGPQSLGSKTKDYSDAHGKPLGRQEFLHELHEFNSDHGQLQDLQRSDHNAFHWQTASYKCSQYSIM
ncbi:uncharacterized protein [Narcine bancroftii]|uniref:uncharacterized protein isoform X2 n=1 Tax=Narcine bancroftii TaxID=1343680 RepID=UPI003831C8C9